MYKKIILHMTHILNAHATAKKAGKKVGPLVCCHFQFMSVCRKNTRIQTKKMWGKGRTKVK